MINRFARLNICADQVKFHGVLAKCLPVKRIQLVGDIMIAELRVEEITRFQE